MVTLCAGIVGIVWNGWGDKYGHQHYFDIRCNVLLVSETIIGLFISLGFWDWRCS